MFVLIRVLWDELYVIERWKQLKLINDSFRILAGLFFFLIYM